MPLASSPARTLPYTVRSSRRTRRVSLRVEPGLGLVVSVPNRFARRDIPGVVERHRAWAESALAELERRTPAVCRAWPPEVLELAALDRAVAVRIDRAGDRLSGAASRGEAVGGSAGPRRAGAVPLDARAVRATWHDVRTLAIDADPDDRAGVATAVADALRPLGRSLLVPRLSELAARHDLAFERVAVRGQRSVWGSCSARGTISLNWKLLFLRPALVDYVLVHELAHTRHLNHSGAFWSLLERLEPDARALDAELAAAGRLVPPWLELARSRSASPP